MPSFFLTIAEKGKGEATEWVDLNYPLSFGRQDIVEDPLLMNKVHEKLDDDGSRIQRLFFVPKTLTKFSRKALRLNSSGPDCIRVEKLGKTPFFYVVDQKRTALEENKPVELKLPFTLATEEDRWTFKFEPRREIPEVADPTGSISFLGVKAIPPFSSLGSELFDSEDTEAPRSIELILQNSVVAPIDFESGSALVSIEKMDIPDILKVLESTLGIIQSAMTDREFFERAVQLMINLLDLDQAWALTLSPKGQWDVVAMSSNPNSLRTIKKEPNDFLLRKLKESGQSAWMRTSDENLTFSEVEMGLSESVGAPVLDPKGQVIGGLCGIKFVSHDLEEKKLGVKTKSQKLAEIRAIIMQILAGCVATGIAHLTMKGQRDQMEILMEQYFTKKISVRILSDPALMRGSECEITSLFCDIRNFSRISATLEPDVLLQWLQETLNSISECVPQHDGVVVDYIGDELMAIWGEISTNTDPAKKAVLAGFAMIDAIEQLADLWQEQFGGQRFAVGVGINTGNAFVGNIGTPRKLKFGAIGNSVNLASRVQGVTKYFQCPFLVTHNTWTKLNGEFVGRRIGAVTMVNIPQPVELYQVFRHGNPELEKFCADYETALLHYENKEYRESARLAGQILGLHRDDRPTIMLMQRAIDCLVDPDNYSRAVILKGK